VTRQPSSAMNGSNNAADIRTGLVIGIHQKELAFGRQVAAILPPKNIRIVQIDQGLPQQDSFEGKRYYYGVFHREIYLQLHQQLKKKIDLLINPFGKSFSLADFHHDNIEAIGLHLSGVLWFMDEAHGPLQRARLFALCWEIWLAAKGTCRLIEN
jgi:hypothetical protein